MHAYLKAAGEHLGEVLRAAAQHLAIGIHGCTAEPDLEDRDRRIVEVSHVQLGGLMAVLVERCRHETGGRQVADHGRLLEGERVHAEGHVGLGASEASIMDVREKWVYKVKAKAVLSLMRKKRV